MQRKRTHEKTKLSIAERIFNYAFRDFKDIRLSAYVNDYNEPINIYSVYLSIPGMECLRGLKAMTSHMSTCSKPVMHMLEHFDELLLTFPEDMHEALKKKMRRAGKHWCQVSVKHWCWKNLRECIGKRFLDMLNQHGNLKVFCWVSGKQKTFIDVKSYEELMMKTDLWESLEK